MTDSHQAAVAEAFSRKSRVYDAFGDDHPNLGRMRLKVRRHVERLLQPGDRILELNAGTGADAVYFARLGYRVHATDLSPGMVSRINEKAALEGLHDRLAVQRLDFNHLKEVEGGPYDCVFSNMGGINCAADLSRVVQGVKRVLSPNGVVVWVVMPPACLWEWAALLRGDWRTAVRRMRPGGVRANVEGVQFTTRYYSAPAVRRAFGPGFRPLRLEGLSVFTPPADHKTFTHKHPKLYARLVWLDDLLANHPPFSHLGDFFILSLFKV